MTRIQVFQHHPAEGAAHVASWAAARGHALSITRLFEDPPLPRADAVEWLVVLGGPMNVYEEARYPWLAREKAFLRAMIDAERPVLGICLGAQLLADVLGGPVTRNDEREIGWFPVTRTPAAGRSPIFRALPERFDAFHWHGDTFAVPPRAVHAATSEGCANQAFEAGGRWVGLQFHLESPADSISELIGVGADDLATAGRFVQPPDEMLADPARVAASNRLMELILDAMERRVP